jgi:hypothetical protein
VPSTAESQALPPAFIGPRSKPRPARRRMLHAITIALPAALAMAVGPMMLGSVVGAVANIEHDEGRGGRRSARRCPELGGPRLRSRTRQPRTGLEERAELERSRAQRLDTQRHRRRRRGPDVLP